MEQVFSMSSSSNFSAQGNQLKAGRGIGYTHGPSIDQTRDLRESKSLQPTIRMGNLVTRNTASPTAAPGLTKSGTLRSISSPKGIKDGRIGVSETVQTRAPIVGMDTHARPSKNRSIVQGREITSRTSWVLPADGGFHLGPRSPTVTVNSSFEVALGPTARLTSSCASSPFLVATAGDEGLSGSEASMGSARSQKALPSTRGLVSSLTAKRGSMPNGWAVAPNPTTVSQSVSSSRGTAPTLQSAVQLLGKVASKQEDRVLQDIFQMFVSRLDQNHFQSPALGRDRLPVGNERSMRVAQVSTQTVGAQDFEFESSRRVSDALAESLSCDGSGHESGWLLSARESGDEWGDGRTSSSVASMSSRIASSTAASQCTTLPFDPADYETGNLGSFCAEHSKIDRDKSEHSKCDEDRDTWARIPVPSLDTLQELQRYIDFHMRINTRKGYSEEGSPTSTHGRAVRASPGPWSPATMEIRRLAQDDFPRTESPASNSVSHPHYRPPNPGGSNGSGRFGLGEQVRADSDSLSSSGTPASASLKLTPRLCRNPPLHATRVPRCSRDSTGGGSTDGVSPRVPPSETLTPRPGPGSSGDSPISTPRDRSAFLAPSKVAGRSSNA